MCIKSTGGPSAIAAGAGAGAGAATTVLLDMTKRLSEAGSPASISPASSPYKSDEHSTPNLYLDRSATYASRLMASFPSSKFRDNPIERWGRGSGGGGRGFVSGSSYSAPGALTPSQACGFSTEN